MRSATRSSTAARCLPEARLHTPLSKVARAALIGVGVSLEIMKQINSQLMARNYEGFLK